MKTSYVPVLAISTTVANSFTSYTYDPATGKQAGITTPEGTINYTYDPATDELVETWTGTTGKATSGTDIIYGYDQQGRLSTVTQVRLNGATIASGHTTTNSYDNAGNLLSDTDTGVQQTIYTYDDLNRLTLEAVTNLSTAKLTFKEQIELYDDGTKKDATDTRYNSDGSIFSQTKVAWTYDADSRLTSETLTILNDGTGGTTNANGHAVAPYADKFRYDLANNRTEEDINSLVADLGKGNMVNAGSTILYTYDSDDQLIDEHQTAFGGSTVYDLTYVYDSQGNLSIENGTGTKATTNVYTYDLQDRMTKSVINSTETDYGYDTSGVRVTETDNAGTSSASTTYYLNDPNNPTGYTKAIEDKVGRSQSTATVSRSYVLGLKVEGQSDSTNGVLYLLTDGHGSTRAVVNASGVVQEAYDYDAYGKLLENIASPKTNWLFSGDGVYDPASGWTYHLARWTNGFWFTQADGDGYGSDADPISLNKYLYAGDNPVSYVDPSGHEETLGGQLGVTGLQLGLLGLGLVAFGASRNAASHTAAAASAASAAVSDIEDLISSGASALEAEGNKLLGRAADVAKAIDAAIDEALAAGRATLSTLSKLKIFPIVESAGPAIYKFDVGALAANPAWYVLNYNGLTPSGVLQTAANRAYVFSLYGQRPAPSGKQLDEFPFASTQQGGPGPFGPALGKYVPTTENSYQGLLLTLFYHYEIGWSTSPFLVVPIPV